jgi:hypothetical protein
METRVRTILAGLAGAVLAFLLTACSTTGEGGAPPSLARPVIDRPGDTRLMYQTEDSTTIVTLLGDGSYQSSTSDSFGAPLGSHAGRWSWKKTGSHRAELGLDANTWQLTFVSPDSAIAVNPAAGGRTFAFQFERM